MEEYQAYAILMIIFGTSIFLYGVYVYFNKNPYVPKSYGKRLKTKDRLLLAKALMNVSLAPILSAIITLLGNNSFTFFLSWIVLIASFILILKYTIKKNN